MSQDVWERLDRAVASAKAAGKREVGLDLPPAYTPKKPRHVPKPGKTWSAWVRARNKKV